MVFALSCLHAGAQETSLALTPKNEILDSTTVLKLQTNGGMPSLNSSIREDINPDSQLEADTVQSMPLRIDTLSLIWPGRWNGWYAGELHQGLNISLGASVFGLFGRHAHGGAGFSQNISALYALSLTPRLSLAIGGYYHHLYWHREGYRDSGLSAFLRYQLDDHWEFYLYGQKSLSHNQLPLPLYETISLGDRIGAAVRYHVNPAFSIQVSVEQQQSHWPHAKRPSMRTPGGEMPLPPLH